MCITNMFSQSLYLSAEGNSTDETKIIDSLYYQKNFEDFASLKTEISSITNRLTKLGYIEIDFVGLKKQNDSTYLAKYHLNQRFKMIRIYFDNSINRNVLKLVPVDIHKNHFDIDIITLEKTLNLLNTELSNQGDPFSTLQLSNIKRSEANVLYANLIVSGQMQQRTIDSIIIKGYEKFPKSFVKRYLKIKPKQSFNLKSIKDKMAELDNLVFASQIKDPEVLFTRDSTLLYIYLEKQQSNAFDGFLGFGTNEESGKIEFNGYLNLNLTNNLNYGESLKLLYKSDENEQKTFDVNARLPFLFSSPLGVELGLNIFRKDSSFVTVNQTVKLEYQINSKNLISSGINAITSTDLLDSNINFVNDYKSTFYTLYYVHTKRQRYDLLFPVNFQFDFEMGFGSRTIENSSVTQSKFYINTFKIFKLNEKNSFFIRLNGAVLNSTDFLENELFRFGGINSVGGFEENSLIANLFSAINTEYRYELNNSLYIHSVFDASYFENKIVDTKGKLFSYGFGFGLLTKAGLFKLNYSIGKIEKQSFKLSDSKIHLSLSSSF